MKNEPYTIFHTDESVLTKADSTVLPPGEASWEAGSKALLPSANTYARSACMYERDGGLRIDWLCKCLRKSSKTKKDSTGRIWDVFVPGSLVFTCVKDPAGPREF
jgi:hypothetical protein